MTQDRDAHGDGMVDRSCSRARIVDMLQDPNQHVFPVQFLGSCVRTCTLLGVMREKTRPGTSVLASV